MDYGEPTVQKQTDDPKIKANQWFNDELWLAYELTKT